MGVSVSVVVAVSAEALDRPVAAVSYAVPVSALSYIQLIVSTVLDQTGRYKLVQDSTVVIDAAILAFGKGLTAQVYTADSQTFAVGKALADTTTATEDLSRVVSFVRSFADTYGVTDSSVIAYIKRLYDTFTATDAITTITFAKFLADGVAMNDAFDATDGAEWAFTKGVSNIVFTGDSFSRAVDYSRGFSDATYGFSETKFFDFVKSLADNTTTSDTGSLRSQGYCDFSYFAEDYVGDSRTF
jgi:hypothetical protein